ncbi:MAG: hypothetical protein FWG30_07885 [Eubacteriaceae bacterium]|jgi:flagellar hook-basal body complex protein FliE|nr:hypothetical protein [Eubacteriaceae bacterium]
MQDEKHSHSHKSDEAHTHENEAKLTHEHTHEGDEAHSHEHTHESGQTHSHDHAHESGQSDSSDANDLKTLQALIGHWIEHNRSHAEGYLDWAQKAQANAADEAAAYIRQAAQISEDVCNALAKAQQALE